MKKILLIATGGTIASKPESGLLTPRITSEELLEFVPEIADICQVVAMQLYNKDSTNMSYHDWFMLADTIRKHYEEYDGFVVAHGTDTMAYGAAALSYFIQNNAKPVVITGSQKSIYLRDTDARANLYNAFVYAADDNAHFTHVVFDGKVILGTRAKKTRTKSFNAFSSIDYPEVAWIMGNKVKYFIREEVKGQPVFCKKYDPSVFVVKFIPGMKSAFLHYMAGKCSAVVIESFGVGGIPCYDNDDYEQSLKTLHDSGVKIVITTQVPHEGSDMEVYKVGKIKKELGLIEAHDMTVEAIVGKLVWALGEAKNDEEFETLFQTPVGMDMF